MGDFLAEKMEPPEWLVDGLVPAGANLGGLLGQYKAGKSLAGLQLCFAVAVGKGNWLGHDITKRGPTVFIEYEGSRVRLQGRVALMAAKYGAIVPPAAVDIIHRPKRKVDTDAGEAWLRAACEGKVLCVIGPVSKAASIVNENDQAEWARLSERLQRVADKTGCTIILIHHTRKPAQTFGPPRKVDDYFNMARGSNSYMGAVDFALGVQREPDDTDGTLFYLERDGESGRLAYDFDTQSLCIWPSDRPLTRDTAADKAQLMLACIGEHPGCTRKDLMTFMDCSEDTLKDYLVRVGEAIIEAGEGNQRRSYTAAP